MRTLFRILLAYLLATAPAYAYMGDPPLLVANGGTGATTLTAHGPIVGAGASPLVALTPVAGSLMYQATAGADPAMSATPSLGVASTTAGTLTLFASATANGITLKNQGATGAYNWNYPATAGSTGQLLASGGGGATAMTFDNISSHLTAGTNVTLSGTTNVTINATGAPAIARFTSTLPVTLSSTNFTRTVSRMGTPGAGVYNLPASPADGFISCLKDDTTNFGTNNATVKTTDSSKIDEVVGTTGKVMNQTHQDLCFQFDATNTNWNING